ncbi:recombinase family protein [Spirosoma sp. RP8]|uniref:Recombinase family protein n=1 Tax=Spirosoma liriopis TaxID=2937440 RepID=A0ABT0HVB7_9BACT|nr:recombinase family protein [Spirosoma liriopis]MCK8496089.1 recombinase family protein [Spirosoma liriopis]
MQTFVAYYRVSTKKQGQSGLGLDAQRSSVLRFVKEQTLLVAEFCDIESGKNDQRPELGKAIDYANRHNARLVIAKLDRLSRNMTFVSSLMDSKVSFVCADMPDANEFTIHIFAALAQQERKMIGERTKKALDEKLLRVGQWRKGANSFLRPEVLAKAAQSNRDRAANNENNRKASELIHALSVANLSYVEMARRLNRAGFKTARGGHFQATQVMRLAKQQVDK